MLLDRPKEKSFALDYADTHDRQVELWRLDAASYGDFNITQAEHAEWLRKAPGAVPIILCDDAIVAAMGLFPISEKSQRLLIAGDIKESQLEILEEETDEGFLRHHKHWHVGGVVVAPGFQRRKNNPLRQILHLHLDSLLRSNRVSYRNGLHITTIACSKAGIQLCRRFAFERLPNGADNCPIYCKNLYSVEEATTLLEEVVP